MSAGRPILFSAPMVRALLDGRKTQTRRLIKIPSIEGKRVPIISERESLIELEAGEFARGICHYQSTAGLSGPYKIGYAVGDRLWVRERTHIDGRQANYAADCDPARDLSGLGYGPAIHMPRWASRLTLEVTDVRVERLKEISHDDAVAEGCYRIEPCAEYPHGNAWGRAGYAALWDQLHGQGSWETNPEVVALAFIVHKSNIDAMPKREAA